jgi:hypothetical protein
MTMSEDALAFDRHLDAITPDVADIARALRLEDAHAPWLRAAIAAQVAYPHA